MEAGLIIPIYLLQLSNCEFKVRQAFHMEPEARFELATLALRKPCSTTELLRQKLRICSSTDELYSHKEAGEGSRTLVSTLGRLHNSRYTTPALS